VPIVSEAYRRVADGDVRAASIKFTATVKVHWYLVALPHGRASDTAFTCN